MIGLSFVIFFKVLLRETWSGAIRAARPRGDGVCWDIHKQNAVSWAALYHSLPLTRPPSSTHFAMPKEFHTAYMVEQHFPCTELSSRIPSLYD